MRALTLWPEWAACICYAGKNVENRGWMPPEKVIGARIAIHAGAFIGGAAGLSALMRAEDAIHGMGGRVGNPWLRLVEPSVGLVKLRVGESEGFVVATRAIVATAKVGEPTRCSFSPWAVLGECHWPLLRVRVLQDPVPLRRGALGLWALPPDVEARVRAQEAE
jgi:hypothetical protein